MMISVQVKLDNRAREEVVLVEDGYVVYVKARPIEGKATEAARKLMARHFNVAPSRVKFIRGATSRHKVFEIF